MMKMESTVPNISDLKNKMRYLQVILWGSLVLIMLFENLTTDTFLEALVSALVDVAVVLGAVYVHYHFILNFFLQGKYIDYLFLLVVVVFLITGASFYLYLFLSGPYPNMVLETVALGGFMFFILPISGAYRFIDLWIDAIEKQARTENQKLESEIRFLRSQINPHFFFNTLNNIYSLIQKRDPEAGNVVTLLSELMRYMIYDCGQSRVKLVKEVSFLEKFIKLQSLRIPHASDRIDFYVEGVNNEHEIAPLILISFLENSFKHGDIGSDSRGYISVSLIVEEGNMTFQLANSHKNGRAVDHGIGLTNSRKQLEITYPEKHSMEVKIDELLFELNLHLDLQN